MRTPHWFAALGCTNTAAIATGVVILLGFEPAAVVNFLGYVLWSVWLLVFAVLLGHGAFGRQVAVIPTSSTGRPQTN
ncbi:hypothetical protein [Nocardia salmonicida]|uniref:hypothetical protein n=1 Tax=Nocardia salmonicida TaxID=53431 RepID=UPI0033DD9AAA